jgi:sporulation delaying protein SdpA
VAVPPGEDHERAQAAQGFSFTISALAVIFAAAVASQVFDYAVDESRTFWPVAFRLYVDSAHNESAVVYRFDENTRTYTQLTKSIGSPEYARGLSRAGYADLIRTVSMVGAVPRDSWRDCAAPTVSECAEAVVPAPRATIHSQFATWCGPTVLAVERPTGWGSGRTRRVVRLAIVDAVCSE